MDLGLNVTTLPYHQTHWLQLIKDINLPIHNFPLTWDIFFPFALWHIWKNRNRNVFNGTNLLPDIRVVFVQQWNSSTVRGYNPSYSNQKYPSQVVTPSLRIF